MIHRIEPARPLAREVSAMAMRCRHAHCAGLFLAALALSACAPHPVATVYCLTPPQLEKLKAAEPPLIGDKLTGQSQDDFKLVAGSDIMLRQYSHDLIHVLENCTEAPGK